MVGRNNIALRSGIVLRFCLMAASVLTAWSDRAGDRPKPPIDNDGSFQTILDKTGKLTVHAGTLQTTVNPSTAQWRVVLSSTRTSNSKGNDDSTVRMTVWIEAADASGSKTFRAMNGIAFKGRGGDGTTLAFDNGVDSDGKPRNFKITVDGKNVSVEVVVQDQGDGTATGKKKDKK